MKTDRDTVEAFFRQRTVAVFGVSRNPKKFGNAVFRQLKERGGAYIVHPEAKEVEGEPCYPDLSSVPERVEAAVLVIPPAKAEQAVKDCVDYGIQHIWLQQGAESEAAIRYCDQHGVHLVHHECILMFAEPVHSIHKFHRTLWKWFGKLPAPSTS